MQPDPQNLSRRERQIMDVIYRQRQATAQQVMEEIPDPPGYSTVRTLLGVLEKKGFVYHKRRSYHYVYYPTTPAAEACTSALEHVMDTFFEGSPQRVVSALIDLKQEKLTKRDYQEILDLIEQSKKEGY